MYTLKNLIFYIALIGTGLPCFHRTSRRTEECFLKETMILVGKMKSLPSGRTDHGPKRTERNRSVMTFS